MHFVYTHLTDHASSREGARIHAAVLHTTEGHDSVLGRPPADLVELGQIFDGEEASAHMGVDEMGAFGRYVEDAAKAWAVCDYNSTTLSLEQIAFAAFSKEEWFKRPAQLHGAAEFLAYCHVHYGVPLAPGECSNGAITKAGVFQHKDFGVSGSGHTDCGSGYPQGYVTELAQYFVAHKLHPSSVHTERLRHKINAVRQVHHLPLIGVGTIVKHTSELAPNVFDVDPH